jgi:hypothetical protein
MNVIARVTLDALRRQNLPDLPFYNSALAAACNDFPPPFGRKAYGELYRRSAVDPDWTALSLLTAAESEGSGARHLWDLAASTPEEGIARQIQAHAIDEARHSRGYVRLFSLLFPDAADDDVRARLRSLSPNYSTHTPLAPTPGSRYAFAATVDEFVQMNIAEIRTLIYHRLQRPILLDQYCSAPNRARVRHALEWLLIDETQHIAYTARLIEQAAQAMGAGYVGDLMRERVKDFNQLTEQDIAHRSIVNG